MITDKELEKMGIIPQNNKIFPYRYYSELLEGDINIFKDDTPESVLEKIYDIAYERGVSSGKAIRSREINRLLNNDESKST